MLKTHVVTCNLSRWTNGGNNIYKKGQWKLKHFEGMVFQNKFFIIFHSLWLCIFISVQNIGRNIPLKAIIYHMKECKINGLRQIA